ncbi:MAG: nascent polypeptide-associated complex protein [Candidatus Nanoarchaeia archaeon]
MIPGMNPRQMQKMMKKMGMQQQDLDATEVIIKCKDKDLVFTNPQVSAVNMMGQKTYQIMGEPEERAKDSTPDINADDLKTIMDQTNVDEETARKTLEETKGDLAEAILKLQ